MPGRRSYAPAADVGGDPYVQEVAVVGPATEPFAWVPRAGAGYTPGFYNVCDAAYAEEAVAIPTTNRPKSLVLAFHVSTADFTLTPGFVAFATSGDDVGAFSATSTLLGFQANQAIEYVLPDDVTHVIVAGHTNGNVARGMWSYE
jgi:hypothetical protein